MSAGSARTRRIALSTQLSGQLCSQLRTTPVQSPAVVQLPSVSVDSRCIRLYIVKLYTRYLDRILFAAIFRSFSCTNGQVELYTSQYPLGRNVFRWWRRCLTSRLRVLHAKWLVSSRASSRRAVS